MVVMATAAVSDARRLCSGSRWVALVRPFRQAHARAGTPCALCGLPIDYDLPPGRRRSFSVDHIIPLWTGRNADPLDPAGWRPAHHGCNASRGARERARRDFMRPQPPLYISEAW